MGHELVSHPTRPLAGSPSRIGRKAVIAGVAAAVAASMMPSANAAIELGEGISATGFLDMSYLSVNPDGGSTTSSAGIDQFEMDFMYAGSNGVSAQVDIEYGESASDLTPGDDTFVEQAFVTKQFTDQFSVKFGRFLSYSGWETEEPTGLFQYSGTGYAPSFYGYYQQGVSAYYNGGKFAVMGSIVNDVFAYAGGATERNAKKPGYEVGVALMPFEGFTTKAFFMHDEKTDREVINVWASYATNGFTFAAEYNDADYGPYQEFEGGDGSGYLLMANYAKGNAGITVRYHDFDDDFRGISNASAITISPSYKVGSNLLLVAEFRMDEADGVPDSNAIALEALFTF
jgi:hypothetical protein